MHVDVYSKSSQGIKKLEQLPNFLTRRGPSSILLFRRVLAFYSVQSIRLKQSYIVSYDELRIVVDIVDGNMTLSDRISPNAIDEFYANLVNEISKETTSFIAVDVDEFKEIESSEVIKKGSDYSIANSIDNRELLQAKAKQLVVGFTQLFVSDGYMKQNKPIHSKSIQLASFTLSILAAYKAYLGTRLFFKDEIASNELEAQVVAIIAGFPAVSFYYKSMVIKLAELSRCNGTCKRNLVLDIFLGICYGVSSFGMLELADSAKGLFALHCAVGVVNTFLGTHKSAVISRLICPPPVINAHYQSPLLLRMKVVRGALVDAISAIDPDDVHASYTNNNDPVFVQVTVLNRHLNELIEAKLDTVNSLQGDGEALLVGSQLQHRKMAFPITSHFSTNRFAYSYQVKSFGCEIDLLYPLLVAWTGFAVLVSWSVAAAAIASNIEGLSYAVATAGMLTTVPLLRYVLSAICNVAVFGLNLKDTRKYVELSLTDPIYEKISVPNTGHSRCQRFRSNWVPGARDWLSLFWSSTQAPAGVYFTWLAIQNWGFSVEVIGFILISNAFLVTSTKAKTVNWWLQQINEYCCGVFGRANSNNAFFYQSSLYDQNLFGLMKTYIQLIDVYNSELETLAADLHSDYALSPLKQKKLIADLNTEISTIASCPHTLEVRENLQQLLYDRCALMDQDVEFIRDLKASSQASVSFFVL